MTENESFGFFERNKLIFIALWWLFQHDWSTIRRQTFWSVGRNMGLEQPTFSFLMAEMMGYITEHAFKSFENR